MISKNKITFFQALLKGRCQRWECQRWFNNRGNIFVYQISNQLWQSSTEKKVTKKALIEDGWKLVWVSEYTLNAAEGDE